MQKFCASVLLSRARQTHQEGEIGVGVGLQRDVGDGRVRI